MGQELHCAAIARLRDAGWRFEASKSARDGDPSVLAAFSADVSVWANSFALLASADETTWFLAADDYEEGSDNAFAWNEFEKVSLDASEDEEQVVAVTEFWSRHLPVLLSVRDRYAYLAVRSDGMIVCGEEPEFEDAEVVAGSLAELLSGLARPSDMSSAGAVKVAALLGL
jgi:hypothetical protein